MAGPGDCGPTRGGDSRRAPDALPNTPLSGSHHNQAGLLGRTVTHTFDRSSLSDRVAFRKLYELICSRELPVVGATETFGVRHRTALERCAKLTPEEQVVPRNPSTLEGVRFSLIDFADKNWKQDWDGRAQPQILEKYIDLRVRSSDVYQLWPKANA